MKDLVLNSCSLAYLERENSLIPVLNFSIRKKRFLGIDEIDLYFDGKEYSGTKLGIENDEDLSSIELKSYSKFIENHDGYINCNENITTALNYFYENNLSTTYLKFMAKCKSGYFAIDCTYNDWYGEIFKTKKESINWLFNI